MSSATRNRKAKPRVIQPKNGHVFDPPANMSCEAAAVVAQAFDIAASQNAKEMCPTHLWAALASEPSVGRSLWFETLQCPDDRTEVQVRGTMLRRLRVRTLRAIPNRQRPPLSIAMRDAIHRAAEEARQLGHADIGPEHLVLALMYGKRADLFKDAETYSLAYVIKRHELGAFRVARRGTESRNGTPKASVVAGRG